jgi:hypothetical protein
MTVQIPGYKRVSKIAYHNTGREAAMIKRKKMMRLEPGFPVLGQAVPAVDRPSFSGLEGDFAFFATV